MIPKSFRNRLLRQVLIAVIGFDFTCDGGDGGCQFLSGSVSEEEQKRRLFTTVLDPCGTVGFSSVNGLIVIDCKSFFATF